MLSRQEWTEWKLNNVTRAFFAAAEERIEDAKEILATSAGQDSSNDNFFRGFVAAYREMESFRIEDMVDE